MTDQLPPRVCDLLDQATGRLRAGVTIDEAALAISSAKRLLAALALATVSTVCSRRSSYTAP